jgi:hypothetical protein
MKATHLASLLAVTVATLVSSADAKPVRQRAKAVEKSDLIKVKDIEVKGETGEDFVLGMRRATEVAVDDADKAPVRSVGETAVAKVVSERAEELEYCWLRVPAAKRTASSAMLKLMIEASGSVVFAELDGDVPAGVSKCVTAAASKWTFPAADEGCEVEHGLSFNANTLH